MDSATAAIVLDFPLFLRLYSDGRVERFSGTDVVPTSTNPVTGVRSKDIEPIGGEIGNVRGKSFSDKLWMFACPSSSGSDDPMMNPAMDPGLSRLGCEKVLVCVAEKDFLRDRGWYYKEELGKSGWGGVVEIMEAVGEDHVFHLLNPTW
ncbi:alpha/beta-Hydrolases superfamily protein [Actinidia rufa]|uniref:Alpha/beta-Hydrolases superfamily protein n=1 Tax=Actinidia rufa TaxID=165716 RepID=A0A7J0EUH0_9ERIC|nr:alpha/beta-Hydrolases superfamily protein [Actinidia rufa]